MTQTKPSILIIDDQVSNITLLSEILDHLADIFLSLRPSLLKAF